MPIEMSKISFWIQILKLRVPASCIFHIPPGFPLNNDLQYKQEECDETYHLLLLENNNPRQTHMKMKALSFLATKVENCIQYCKKDCPEMNFYRSWNQF